MLYPNIFLGEISTEVMIFKGRSFRANQDSSDQGTVGQMTPNGT
jgi:hypothetical protein